VHVQAPKGQYRVIGRGRIDTLAWPSEGLLCKDCETFNEAKDLADRNGELYFWTYVYNDNGDVLYEAGSYRAHVELLNHEPPEGPKSEPRRKPQASPLHGTEWPRPRGGGAASN
jgi:hypothetical protein